MNINLIPFNQSDTRSYAEQVMDTVDIDLPGEEEHLAKKTLLPELEQELIKMQICPDCGTYMTKYPKATSPHDFDLELVCPGCGTTIS